MIPNERSPHVRQALREAARMERGHCALIETFVTEWELAQIRRHAVALGVSLEVAAGAMVRRGLDGLLERSADDVERTGNKAV